MKLKKLEIELKPSYDKNAGKYVAEIQYEGERGSVEMLLTPEVSEQLLGFIGPVLTKFAHQAALEVEANIIASIQETQQPLIEA